MGNRSLFGTACAYEHAIVDGVICIVDLDSGGPSVTNSIDEIVAELGRTGVDLDLPMIYRDSQGIWDGISLRGARFDSFYSINETERSAAIQKAKARR